MIYALDSNIVSYLLERRNQVVGKFSEAVANGFFCVIPPMVYYEVKRWLFIKNAKSKMLRFEGIYRFTQKTSMDAELLDKAIEIYVVLAKNGNIISDSDILIAAYCILNDYILVSNNTNEFMRVPGLKLENWV